MQRLLLEGPHLVREAAAPGVLHPALGPLSLEGVLATPDFLDGADAPPLLAVLDRPPLAIAPELLDLLCDADSPRGVMAVARRPEARLDDLPERLGEHDVLVYADGLSDPGNLGALARVAEAAGATALLTSPGSVDSLHPRTLRASAGSLLRLPTLDGVPWTELDRRWGRDSGTGEAGRGPASEGPGWWGLLPRRGEDLWRAPAKGPRVLVVGAEAAGISPELAERIDHGLTIPMAGRVESLNATVAAAVVLFEWARRRHPAPEPGADSREG